MTRYYQPLTWTLLVASLSATLWAQMPPPPPRLPPGTPGTPSERTSPVAAPTDPKTALEVRLVLAQLINNATTEGQFHELVTQLSAFDRTHIGELPREDFTTLNQTIARFRQEFQNKYHREFAFKDEILKPGHFNFGATAKVVIVTLPEQNRGGITPATLSQPGIIPQAGLTKDFTTRNAPVVVNGPLIVLVSEGSDQSPQWKLDIPNDMTGRQLKESLTRHLQKVTDERATWPDDATFTYRAAAREVLLALWDTSVPASE